MVWAEAEDTTLLQAVQAARPGSEWTDIARSVSGRTGEQCRNRWSQIFDSKQPTGEWTAVEDLILKNLHARLGSKWAQIAAQMRWRHPMQCRIRWIRTVNPRLVFTHWTVKERVFFAKLYAVHGSDWTRIAEFLGTRSDIQCAKHFEQHANLYTAKKNALEEMPRHPSLEDDVEPSGGTGPASRRRASRLQLQKDELVILGGELLQVNKQLAGLKKEKELLQAVQIALRDRIDETPSNGSEAAAGSSDAGGTSVREFPISSRKRALVGWDHENRGDVLERDGENVAGTSKRSKKDKK